MSQKLTIFLTVHFLDHKALRKMEHVKVQLRNFPLLFQTNVAQKAFVILNAVATVPVTKPMVVVLAMMTSCLQTGPAQV